MKRKTKKTPAELKTEAAVEVFKMIYEVGKPLARGMSAIRYGGRVSKLLVCGHVWTLKTPHLADEFVMQLRQLDFGKTKVDVERLDLLNKHQVGVEIYRQR